MKISTGVTEQNLTKNINEKIYLFGDRYKDSKRRFKPTVICSRLSQEEIEKIYPKKLK